MFKSRKPSACLDYRTLLSICVLLQLAGGWIWITRFGRGGDPGTTFNLGRVGEVDSKCGETLPVIMKVLTLPGSTFPSKPLVFMLILTEMKNATILYAGLEAGASGQDPPEIKSRYNFYAQFYE